jgi:hypothetical protein
VTAEPAAIVLSSRVSLKFRREIARSLGASWHHRVLSWSRPLTFFAAFIVLPGILGYFGITSDRFNVGLMSGGALAMVLDGGLMRPKPWRYFPWTFYDKGTRELAPGRIRCDQDGHRIDLRLTSDHRPVELRQGLYYRLGKRGVFPVEYSELPEGTDRDVLKGLLKAAAA